MLDRVGQQIGNYRLLRVLGQGGFAQVYLGEHRYLKSAAALKILQRSLTEKETHSFLEEAQTLVRLRHAHIVRVLDFAIERGTPVLIMDYVPGGTLRQRHPRGTCLSLAMTVGYVKQIAAALQYAHNQHLIHRDVKPENILLDTDQRLVLSDFGLALLAPSPDLLSTQELAGTLPYIAPEQVRGKPSFASDQYALGIVTYEWLCGARPFEGSAWEVINQHLTVSPPSLHERYPELPVAVEQVVLKALAKDPHDRYVSVSAFAQALERACRQSVQHDEDSQVTAPLGVSSRSSAASALGPSRPEVHTSHVVFLSAAPGDELVAARLATDMKRRGIVLSNEGAGPVSEQEDALRQAMRAAHRVVVVATPQTRSSRLVKEHLHLAQMYQRRLVLVWMHAEEMATILLDQTWEPFLPVDVVDARGERYHIALDELLVCLREDTRVSPYEESTLSTTPEEPRNPYKGLRAFREEDALDFFGRDTLLEEATEQLKSMLATEQRAVAGPRLLTMVGPSGSGKSSVVLAGLLPRLRAGALPGSEAWVYLEPMVPGTHPIEALALTLAAHFSDRSVKAICEDLQDDSARGLHRLATQLVKGPDGRLVLVVDQFEELFTQTISEEERRCFLDLLVTAVTDAHGPVLVLLTLRADFSDRPMRYPLLYRLMQEHLVPVLPMETHDLRAIIEEPSTLPDVQLTFEGNLLGDLLFEAQGQVGALPLLEFILDQLFQQRDGHTLTMAAYRKLGGVKGALAKHAEETYAALPSEEHRCLARALFLRLIDPDMSEQDTTRRRAALAELSLPNAKQTVILQEVADAFVAARLLTTNEIAGTTTIEVSHEALIREWPHLSDWLREGRDDIRLQQAISEDATEWEQHHKPGDRLYRGSQLREAQAWATRNTPSGSEVTFLHASAAQRLRSVVSVTVIMLLLLSTTGLAGWFLTRPNPTHVTTLNDSGPGSLRQAVDLAQMGSTITFSASLRGTILLSGNLIIAKDLIIRGPGEGLLSISGGASGHIIRVVQGVTITIFGLTFKDSNNSIGDTGFIDNQGTLILNSSTISGNIASSSGGTYDTNGKLTLSTSSGGGGISNEGALTLTNSTVSANKAIGGGGIYNVGTPTTSTTSTTSTTIINSTISDNKASSDGGGIFIQSSIQSINPSTIEEGLIQANLTFSTIYGNTAHSGGDIAIEDEAFSPNDENGKPSKQVSQVKIRNSILAGDPTHLDSDIVGTITSNGYNLVQNVSGTTFGPSQRPSTDVAVDPSTDLKIDPQLSGKLPQTHALLPGSPAIDRIPVDACHPTINGITITTDQREVKRPQGAKCDIGAYEYAPPT